MKIRSRLIAHIFVRRGSTYVNQNQNNQRPILIHISAAKVLHFCDICL